MTEEQKQALIEHIETCLGCLKNVALKYSDECEHEWILRDIQVQEIALAALTAQPVAIVEPRDYVTAAQLIGEEPLSKSVRPLFEGALFMGQKLYTDPPAPALRVPEGWKLVPVEPTKEMRLASRRYVAKTKLTSGPGFYRAMLAAAPNPPK